jgi:uncharacterized protein YjbI with pentapeptide repeats
MYRIQKAYPVLLICAAIATVARGEAPTAQAISTYSAECKQAGKAMDLIARFGTDYTGLDLSGVDFRGAHAVGLETNLQGADFSGANLQGAEFGAALLDGVDFTGANLSKAQFVTASLRQAIFRKARLAGAHFQECDLAGAQFQQVTLTDATWAGYQFQGADLTGANLSSMSLRSANFKNATLRAANLSGCRLEESDFTGADLAGADLSRASFRGANFHRTQGLEDKELARLVTESGFWELARKKWITDFMDSPLFALCLLVLVPLATVAGHVLLRRRDSERETVTRSKFQISLASLLTIVLGVALLLGIARWSMTGTYSFAMVCALTMMAAEIFYARAGRAWPATVLALALGYTAANVALFFAALHGDSYFSILNPSFMGTVVLLGPLLMITAVLASVFVPRATRANPPWTGLAGLIIWMIGVGAANLYLIAEVIASI